MLKVCKMIVHLYCNHTLLLTHTLDAQKFKTAFEQCQQTLEDEEEEKDGEKEEEEDLSQNMSKLAVAQEPEEKQQENTDKSDDNVKKSQQESTDKSDTSQETQQSDSKPPVKADSDGNATKENTTA